MKLHMKIKNNWFFGVFCFLVFWFVCFFVFLMGGWLGAGIDCPERLWSLHLWSTQNQAGQRENFSCTCFEQGSLDESQTFFLKSTIHVFLRLLPVITFLKTFKVEYKAGDIDIFHWNVRAREGVFKQVRTLTHHIETEELITLTLLL